MQERKGKTCRPIIIVHVETWQSIAICVCKGVQRKKKKSNVKKCACENCGKHRLSESSTERLLLTKINGASVLLLLIVLIMQRESYGFPHRREYACVGETCFILLLINEFLCK